MDSDRPHRTGSTSSSASNELFICFTSRLSSSSSSMKISSKSILSPGRARDQPSSLSTSLSRRLHNGSMKGQASPMFPTGGKKRGCGFENPEPSSPKVTCIGQVRVKTKKQGKKMRTLSRRHTTGEVSFRKLDQGGGGGSQNQCQSQIQSQNQVPVYPTNHQYHHQQQQQQEGLTQRNQRWVHLPLTICEALRAFGSEFSCLFPCRSSCFSREKEEQAAVEGGGGQSSSSCGAVFGRWLVSVQDGEGGKGREIELMVDGGDDENERTRVTELITEMPIRNSRRHHVFDDIEIKDGEVCEVEEGRVSMCVPPKNALLLMRCRSDPVKMEALASRFWESPAVHYKDEEEEKDLEEEIVAEIEECELKEEVEMVELEDEGSENWVSVNVSKDEELYPEGVLNSEMEEEKCNEEETQEEQRKFEEETPEELKQTEIAGEIELNCCSSNQFVENVEEEERIQEMESVASHHSLSSSVHSDEEEEEAALLELELEVLTLLKETAYREFEDNKEETVVHERSDPEETRTHEEVEEEGEREEMTETEERGNEVQLEKKDERECPKLLPDCLLLMMCEPKLSMEVSKETWVCSTDFIRWHPEKKKPPPVKPTDVLDHEHPTSKKTVNASSTNPPRTANQPLIQQQPRRSSISLPPQAQAVAGVSMAAMIEQKLVNAVGGYEPFVLKRCKSAPMRTAAKLAPDTCFWKNRKMEPHRRSAFGVSAAGVGF